jgi:predicted GIY-YIG superfamily endonuclease
VYIEKYNTGRQAIKRETELKKYKSRVIIEKIIGK